MEETSTPISINAHFPIPGLPTTTKGNSPLTLLFALAVGYPLQTRISVISWQKQFRIYDSFNCMLLYENILFFPLKVNKKGKKTPLFQGF
jgi:hypothetical protein